MHRTIGYLSKRVVHIKPGEGRKVLLTFLYFFLIITAYYIIKPASRAFALEKLGWRLVPYIDLVSAALMGPIVTLFARLVDRITKRGLVAATFWAVIGCLIVFWWLLRLPGRWVVASFSIWVSIFSVLVVTLFWLVANDLYHPREAKRLFGFIGSGGILGGIAGSSIAAAGARLMGANQLLLCSAAILVVCWLVVERLWRFAPSTLRNEPASPHAPGQTLSLKSAIRWAFRFRYLVLLIGLVGIAKIISTCIYYQFNPFIEQMFPSADAKTTFTGLFFGWMNVASFIIQFFFTSWILRSLGLAWALLILPIGLLVGSLCLFIEPLVWPGASVPVYRAFHGLLIPFAPIFWVAAVTELYDASMNYSLQQTSKEVLYLPIDRSVRYKIKPFIDMIVFRFGKGIAALLGIILLDKLNLPARVLGYVTIPLLLVWIGLAIQLRHDYITTIRGILRTRAGVPPPAREAASDSETQPSSSPSDDGLERWLQTQAPGRLAAQKLALTTQLFMTGGVIPQEAQPLLEALAQYEQRPEPAAAGGATLEQLKDLLADRHRPTAERAQTITGIVDRGGQEAVDSLLGMLMVEHDPPLRQELLWGLTKLRLRQPRGLEFPKRLIRRQIAKEVETFQQIVQVASIYRHADAHSTRDGDPALGLLGVLVEETTQQIFALLGLVYRPEDIYLIYHQLRQPDAYVRADALELLDNLIDPGLRGLMFPVLDENRFLDCLDGEWDHAAPDGGEAYSALKRGIWDHNHWLSVTAVCVAGRIRLERLLSELDQGPAARSPIVRMAVSAARRLVRNP
ncbi:MAG: hypothetical protein HYZ92_04950 [Candidatus Omnitrophica bacterium]|nr:hypothetical protein [Candidatus Omnitrophota bacterium]